MRVIKIGLFSSRRGQLSAPRLIAFGLNFLEKTRIRHSYAAWALAGLVGGSVTQNSAPMAFQRLRYRNQLGLQWFHGLVTHDNDNSSRSMMLGYCADPQ